MTTGQRALRAVAATCLLAALAPAVSSCAGPGGRRSAPSAAPTLPASQAALVSDPLPGLTLPIERYVDTDEEAYRAAGARAVIENDCLAAGGADYRAPAPHRHLPPPLMAGRYGPVNEQQAALGYHFMFRITSPSVDEPAPVPQAARTRARSCSKKALDEIPDLSASSLTNGIMSGDYAKAASLPAVKAVFAKWSACMAGSGFRYASPAAAMGDRKWDWKSDSATVPEIQVARRDVRCKESAGVVRVWFSGETDLENSDIAKNAGALRSRATALRTEQASVRRILGAGS